MYLGRREYGAKGPREWTARHTDKPAAMQMSSNGRDKTRKNCTHPWGEPGPFYPRHNGSLLPTKICLSCRAWRFDRGVSEDKWQTTDLKAAIARAKEVLRKD